MATAAADTSPLGVFQKRIAEIQQHRSKADRSGRKKKSNPEQEKLAMVYAAIQDVLRARKPAAQQQQQQEPLNVTPTECFAATMTAIEASKGEHLCELFNLLSITLPAVPRPVLSAKWQVMSDVLFQMTKVAAQVELAEANEGRASSRLSRWLVACIASFLRASLHIDARVTNKAAKSRLYDLLLSSTVDPRPKVRRTAQDGLIDIIETGQATGAAQFALGHAYNFYSRVLRVSCLNLGKTEARADGVIVLDSTGLLQLLGFFKRFLPLVPVTRLAPLCKMILNIPALGQPNLTHAALQTMHPVLKKYESAGSSESSAVRQARVSLLELIVSATVDMQPDVREVVPMQSFCALVAQSFDQLYRAHQIGAVLILPRLAANLCKALRDSRQVAVLKALETASSQVFTCFISEGTWKQHAQHVARAQTSDSESAPPTSRAISAVFNFIHDSAFMPVWGYVLPILRRVLLAIVPLANASPVAQGYSDPALVPLVARIAQVFEVVHSADAADEEQTRANNTALRNLVAVLAAGVSCVGVRNFVTVVPLNGGKPSNGSGDAPVKKGVAHSREWVLNFLTSQLASTRRKGLGLFQEYFLPLAGECSALAAQKAEAGDMTWAKHYRDLTVRIWALLPPYLSHPLPTHDVLATFPKLARVMYNAAKDEKYPQLSPIICQALVNIITPYIAGERAVENDDGTQDNTGDAKIMEALPAGELEKAQAMFRRFAPKFVPLLFGQYEKQHGDWSIASSGASNSGGLEEDSNTVPAAPPMPLSAAQIPAGGVGRGGSAERLASLLEAATKYVGIAGTAAADKFASTLLSRLAKAQLPLDKKITDTNARLDNVRQTCVLLGLSRALIPAIGRPKLLLLFRALKMILDNSPLGLVQTRCFAAVESICRREQHLSMFENGKVDPLLADLANLLQDSLVSVAPKAKRRRLRCLRMLVDRGGLSLVARSAAARVAHQKNASNDADLSDDEGDSGAAAPAGQSLTDASKEWLVGFLGEIVLCTKESNSRAREAAFELLTAIGSSALKQDGQDALVDLLIMVSATLAGHTPHMKSAGVIALSRLFYEFRNEAAMERHGVELLRTVLLLMREKSREVVKSVIGFIKVAVSALPQEQLKVELRHIVQALLLWAGESKNRFRLKIKAIFERLVQKFGDEAILSIVPENDKPLISHIIKMNKRAKTVLANEKKARHEQQSQHSTGGPNSKKAAVEAAVRAQFSRKRRARAESESDDDSVDGGAADAEDKAMAKRGRRKDRSQMVSSDQWIRDDDGEGGGDMDLLNATEMARRLRTSEPNSKSTVRVDEDGFAFGADGRMIVPDDSRRIKSGDSDDEEPESALGSWSKQSRQTGGVRAAKQALAAKIRQQRHESRAQQTDGDRFKAKKASGDVQKKGSKLEPFAYIPLDSRSTTKKGHKDNMQRFAKHRNPKGGKASGKRKGVAGGKKRNR